MLLAGLPPGCGLNRAINTTAAVVQAGSTSTVIVTGNPAITTGSPGWIVLTSGANNGIRRPIKSNAAGSLTLVTPLPNPPSVGDTLDVVKGCDKRRTTCYATYNNLDRFRGFPDVPGRKESI